MEIDDVMEGVPAEEGKFCTDCKYLIGVRWNPDESTNWKCGHKNNIVQEKLNLVTGIKKKLFIREDIYFLRTGEAEDICGAAGKWFEKYEKLERPAPHPEEKAAELEVGKGKKVGKFSLDL